MRSALLPTVAKCIGELFWTCFDENSGNMSQYIGYGNCAGFLLSKDQSSIGDFKPVQDSTINPITGSVDHGSNAGLADMTEEEKEREAERLFVLFERLNATGVVKVTNSVSSPPTG